MSTPANHTWKPSNARIVVIDSFVPVPRGTTAVAPAFLNWPAKDPGDILDYALDIAPAIAGNDGDGIATLDVAILPSNPGDLAVQSSTTDGTRAILWLEEGQAGTVYTVTFSISTNSGRWIQRSILLPVLSLAAPPIPVDALITQTGTPLVDQNGNPVVAP
jgi:hypothetical protein